MPANQHLQNKVRRRQIPLCLQYSRFPLFQLCSQLTNILPHQKFRQISLALKVIKQRPFGNAGSSSNPLHRKLSGAFGSQNILRCLSNSLYRQTSLLVCFSQSTSLEDGTRFHLLC